MTFEKSKKIDVEKTMKSKYYFESITHVFKSETIGVNDINNKDSIRSKIFFLN